MSYLNVKPRGAGKSYDSVQRLREQPGTFLVSATEEMSNRLYRYSESQDYGIPRARFVSVGQLARGILRGYPNPRLVLDNADIILRVLLSADIDYLTFTGNFNLGIELEETGIPAPESKPWLDAKVGEIWQFILGGINTGLPVTYTVSERRGYKTFERVDDQQLQRHHGAPTHMGFRAAVITGGTRIWPKDPA